MERNRTYGFNCKDDLDFHLTLKTRLENWRKRFFHIVGGGGDEEGNGKSKECFTSCGSSGNQLIGTAERGPLCYSQRSSAA
ncbi:hypothetical protein F2P79_025213 [Pimephales promelas]|nr:hypothetical protein F2P79_025213 [Pimephales promelas]